MSHFICDKQAHKSNKFALSLIIDLSFIFKCTTLLLGIHIHIYSIYVYTYVKYFNLLFPS